MVVVRGDGKGKAGPPWKGVMELAVKGDNLRKMMEKDVGDGGKDGGMDRMGHGGGHGKYKL